jgi:hypothetical protein
MTLKNMIKSFHEIEGYKKELSNDYKSFKMFNHVDQNFLGQLYQNSANIAIISQILTEAEKWPLPTLKIEAPKGGMQRVELVSFDKIFTFVRRYTCFI